MKNIKPTLSLVLFALLLGLACSSCRAEGSYKVYESELNQLMQIITELETNWNQAKNSLQTSKKQLEQQEKQLQELQIQLRTLQNQLTTLKSQIGKSENLSIQLSEKLSQAETNLETFEESWKRYKSEAEGRIRKLMVQRNIVTAVSVVLGIIAL